MSSSKYFAELPTDNALRRLVLLSGVLLAVVGLLLILSLPLPPLLIGAGALAWCAYCIAERRNALRAYATTRGLQLSADGSLQRLDATGRWRPARLLPGSIVLSKLAWIRFETEQGSTTAEFLRGDSRQSTDWRRLQVIWRHIGAQE